MTRLNVEMEGDGNVSQECRVRLQKKEFKLIFGIHEFTPRHLSGEKMGPEIGSPLKNNHVTFKQLHPSF